MDVVITTLTDIKIDKGNSDIKIRTYYQDLTFSCKTVLAFINNIPDFLFDYIPFKVGELGIKMINNPLEIDYVVNKSGDLVVFGPDQAELNKYSLGGVDNIDLIYTY